MKRDDIYNLRTLYHNLEEAIYALQRTASELENNVSMTLLRHQNINYSAEVDRLQDENDLLRKHLATLKNLP